MTSQTSKTAYKFILVFLVLGLTIAACNNSKDGEKKETTIDTVPKMEPAPPEKKDSIPVEDSLKARPTDPGNKTSN